MFKSTDLPYIIQFAVMFHNDKPVDWLLDPIIETRYCPHDTVRVTRCCRLNFMPTSDICLIYSFGCCSSAEEM